MKVTHSKVNNKNSYNHKSTNTTKINSNNQIQQIEAPRNSSNHSSGEKNQQKSSIKEEDTEEEDSESDLIESLLSDYKVEAMKDFGKNG
eukprot:CAMPEP_0170537480 /NCGR_PEP_ID=MMETSP0209-20121228/102740_1 /TAXON_ID=665100 ORGANISM="Litonotus pictus, Strain P1" /NCGR_SAMPLE_ID=MMETSP0209 /ASSEMBLY_ACC=CAM_ASM_000301 /LENGTH=88 /DNA_ID=CAMNT_0010838985 /DNA_START=1733 /DNA_END=1995 /DNA_ORIENTATION=+